MSKIEYDNVCEMTSTLTDVSVEVEADNMKPGISFEAYVANQRIKLRWNGKIYVGRVANMEFTSMGPKEL
jgi:hypothetical protein